MPFSINTFRNLAISSALATFVVSTVCSGRDQEEACQETGQRMQTVVNALETLATPAWIATGATLVVQGVKALIAPEPPLPRPRARAERDDQGNIRVYRPQPSPLSAGERVKKLAGKLTCGLLNTYLGATLIKNQAAAACQQASNAYRLIRRYI